MLSQILMVSGDASHYATAPADDDGILSALYTIHKIPYFMLPFFGSCLFCCGAETKSLIKKTPKRAT